MKETKFKLSKLKFPVSNHQIGLMFLIASALLSYIFGFAGKIALAYFVTQTQVGFISFGVSLVGSLGFLGFTGLGTASIGPISRNSRGVYRHVLLWQIMGRVVLTFILLVVAVLTIFRNPHQQLFFNILIVQAVLVPWLDISAWQDYLVGMSRFGLLFSAKTLFSLLSLIALLVAGMAGMDASSILVAKYLPVAGLGSILSAAILWRIRNNSTTEAGWFKYGLLRTSFSIVGLLAANLDKVLVGIFISFETLAIVAYAEAFYLISQSIYKAIEKGYSPRIAAEGDRTALHRLIHRHSSILIILLLLWAICIITILPTLVRFLLPPEYSAVARLGQAYVLAWITSIPSILLSPVIWTHHLGRSDVKITTNMHLTRLGSMAILLPTLGVLGLPIARAVSNISNYVFLRLEVAKFYLK